MSKRRAVFIDRDGTINRNRPDHVKSWEEFVFLPGALYALRQLAATGLAVVVTTNQASINRRLVAEETVREIHARMVAAIDQAGGRIDGIYYCPHRPEENCGCRKPRPGMYLQSAHDLDLDPTLSYVIGDTRNDVLAAIAIGARPILVETGIGCDRRNGARECNGCAEPCTVAADLAQAVEWISLKEQVVT